MKPHVVVLHRWQDQYARYAEYLDHRAYAVSYLTTEAGVASVPPAAASVTVVPGTDDLALLRTEVLRLAERFGPPSGIVALKEDDLRPAALLRAEWGCPGPTAAQLEPFLDKHTMLRLIAAAGIPAPAFAPARDHAAVRDFAASRGWPLIVKPYVGNASDGVVRLSSEADLAALRFGERPMLVQAYNPHEIYHVDGVLADGRLRTWRASRYLHNCLDFRHGAVSASAEEDDPRLLAAIGAFTERVLLAMAATDLVFHLELFVDPGPADPDVAFLEIAARPGGAEIPFLWREVHGYDLMAAAFALALGRELPAVPAGGRAGAAAERAALLLVPAPAERPCTVLEATSMVGRVPGPYAEVLPVPGAVMTPHGGVFEHIGGRFRFRASTTAALVEAVEATAKDYVLRVRPGSLPG